MSCASCATGLQRALARVPAVTRADVSFAAELVSVEGAPRAVVEAKIRELGYAVVEAEEEGAESAEDAALLVRLAVSAFFAMSAMLPSMVVLLGVEAAGSPAIARRLAFASALLAMPALIAATPLFLRAARSLRAGTPGMDFLVCLGALVAYGHSTFVLARGGHDVYFDTAALIVCFALLGRVLESRAKKRGLGAMRALDALLPSRAHLVDRATGETCDVPSEDVAAGDRVRVRAGERAPIDGVVVEGSSLADAAILTGEWAPRIVAEGDRVPAGLLLHDGTVVLEVERVVGRREIDLVRRAVEGLLSSRAPIQRLADALSARFALVVLACALATLLVTGLGSGFGSAAWMRAVAVVVVACPCALGLATPMAIAVAATRAASRGILFRDAEAIETAARIDRVLLDKTGTLTEGRPRVTSVQTAPGMEAGDALAIASLLEAGVEHPIARALRVARPAQLRLALEVIAGGGVIGRGDSTFVIGSASFLRAHAVEVPHSMGEGTTSVHLARDGAWLATFALEDAARPTSARAVAALVRDGLRPALVTGDARAAAARLANEVGIAEVHAEVMPLDKAALVEAARREGARVAFVGDGLNDGPALAAADLGIAIAGATDLAAECARIVLLGGGVERVREALAIARETRRRMRQNLAWAFGYNVLAIPLAASGRLSPALAAAAMAASSLSVVLSSLRKDRSQPVS
jgi:Cu+-exporting ATPase